MLPDEKMIADIFTKGSFNKDAWVNLLDLSQIGPSAKPHVILEKPPELPKMAETRPKRKRSRKEVLLVGG